MHKRILVVGLVLVVVLAAGSVGRAAPLFQAQSMITYPDDGATVSRQVEIRGVAKHPNMDFYQLRYAPGPQPEGGSQWQDFAIVEGQQVENDVLGTWDTMQVSDGAYTLALAVWGVDDPNNPYVYFVTNLTVNNADPVDTPTPEQTPTEAAPAETPTSGPTPTPETVEQPPTPTSRPTPTLEPGLLETPTVSPDDGLEVPLNVADIRESFCTGGLITVLLLSLWGLYVVAKAGVRWFLRERSTSSGMGR
ncbi:MAG: hypothetical protein U9R72_09120 [Chloroflexota bacterium]|nr:hypothetical protein [Chloroflexota bacterium]